MSKRRMGAALLCLLLLAGGASASAQRMSFPYAGVALDALEEWTVLTPGTLEAQADVLEPLGVSMEVLAADYAANHTIFEVYLPDGGQVALSVVRTEQTQAWGSAAQMAEEDKAQLLASFTRAPYENAAWADQPGWLGCDWSVQAGEATVSFAALITVRNGSLYTLTAYGLPQGAGALYEMLTQVLAQMTLQEGALLTDEHGGEMATAPAPIADDGKQTPITLLDFSPVSLEETTRIVVQTLPDTELVLRTATDALRGRADAEGMHTYQVSTRRETLYAYTLTATAPERETSEITIAVERQLSKEESAEAYRRSARQVSGYGYNNLVGAPEAYEGKPVTFRGRVGAYGELAGFPCVLIYTENPGRGTWRMPLWVVLTEAVALEMDGIYTVYGDLRGDTLAYDDEESGEEALAPVVISREIGE